MDSSRLAFCLLSLTSFEAYKLSALLILHDCVHNLCLDACPFLILRVSVRGRAMFYAKHKLTRYKLYAFFVGPVFHALIR